MDIVLEFINPLKADDRRETYMELSCRSLQLGDRVRRGPDWVFGNQDHKLPGTVVGQEVDGILTFRLFTLYLR